MNSTAGNLRAWHSFVGTAVNAPRKKKFEMVNFQTGALLCIAQTFGVGCGGSDKKVNFLHIYKFCELVLNVRFKAYQECCLGGTL